MFSLTRDYKYIHLGLVQVALKPLTLLGQNTCLLATLRDGICNNWRASIMGAIETSLCHGPIYFNVYPNLTLSLSDSNIGESLNLRIQTNGYDYLPGFEVIAVIYRIYYKAINTINPKVRQLGPTDQTVLIQTNMFTSNVATNRLISWEEITFPDSWTITNAVLPKPIVNFNIEQIVQDTEGSVNLTFRNPLLGSRSRNARSSFSSHQPYRVSVPTTSRHSVSEPIEQLVEKVPIEGLKISENQIPHSIYRNPSNRRESPTASEMNFSIN